MDSKNADILQIKKYLKGELDTRAMYDLERRALDDPFLMDAIAGYEAAGDQNKASAQLAAALQQRVQKPQARIFSLSRLAMAASVVTVLGVGAWWITSRPVVNNTEVATQLRADNTIVNPEPLTKEQQIIINKDSLMAFNAPKAVIRSARHKRVYREPAALNDIAVTSDETAELAASAVYNTGKLEEVMTMKTRSKTDSVPLNEMLVMGYATQRKKEAAQSDDKAIAGRVAGLSVAAAPVAPATITGKVISAQDGLPIPGVAVRAGSSANAAFTDKDGAYTLKVDSINTNISYNYLGFRTQKLDAGNSAIANVKLEPETTSLNEVIVVNAAAPNTDAQPKYGWDNYQKYLNANSVSPDGKTKSYRVSFTVNNDGSLSNFEVNKADNDIAGQKAIQLIKNGPEWVGSAKGQPKKITVTVKFHKPEK